MKFGLRQSDLEFIIQAIHKFPEIERAVIFGSRAKGNFKKGSDVDIAISGDNVTFTTVSRLHAILEDESPMPYTFDIVNLTQTQHPDLKNHHGNDKSLQTKRNQN